MKPLVVFELANNHMGDVGHGVATIEVFGEVASQYRKHFDFGFKLQYRDLDTFIRPDYRGRQDVKLVKRFEETKLSKEQFRTLIDAMRANGFRTVCTPFDEHSVLRLEADGIDVVKVASCSFTDWPLLERVALVDKPIIASTAGSTLDEIDEVVKFFRNRGCDLTILHCVAEYPAADDKLAVGQVALLKRLHPGVKVGFSTHEDPGQVTSLGLALACGAEVIEKHVGLPTEKYSLNGYSAGPEQVDLWLMAGSQALEMLGADGRYTPSAAERENLHGLRRGVFAKRPVEAGTILTREDVFFAFPPDPGQLTANEWSKYAQHRMRTPIAADAPILKAELDTQDMCGVVGDIAAAVRGLLAASGVVVPRKTDLEISHHYGLEKFKQFGITMLTVVNREYCKKILVMLPGQTHPEQHHKLKEETFVVLHGEMMLTLDGVSRMVSKGDVITVNREVKHEFYTSSGVVFEEISSTHHSNDSYYTDPAVGANKQRKTSMAYWMPA